MIRVKPLIAQSLEGRSDTMHHFQKQEGGFSADAEFRRNVINL